MKNNKGDNYKKKKKKKKNPEEKHGQISKASRLNTAGKVAKASKEDTDNSAPAACKDDEERYRALFDRSLYCVYVHDFEGNFLDANDAALSLLGYTKDEIGSLNFSSLIGEDQVPKAFNVTKEIISRGFQNKFTEYKLKKKDGSYVWVKTDAALIYRGGKPYAIQGIAIDITSRKRAKKLLEESEKIYSSLLKNSPCPVIVVDMNCNIIEVSREAVEVFGFVSPEDIIGREFIGLADPDDRGSAEVTLRQTIKSGIIKHKEHTMLKSNGERFIGDVSTSLTRDSCNKPEAMIFVIRDITEKKQADEQLKDSEKKYRYLFEHSQSVNILVGRNGKIIDINNSASKAMGYEKSEIIGKDALEFVVPKHRRKAAESMSLDFKGENTPSKEFDIITKEGIRTFLFSEGSAQLFENGILSGILLSAADITQHKMDEQVLKHLVWEMSTLNHISRYVNSSLSSDIVIFRALDEIFRTTASDMSMIYEVRDKRMILRDAHTDRCDLGNVGNRVKRVGECLCGLAASERKPFYSKDIHADPHCTLNECKNAGIRSFAAIPLMTGDNLLGVLGLASLTERDFSEMSDFLEICAFEISTALQNALVHEKLQMRANELRISLEDITHVKEALHESESRFRNFFDRQPEYCYMISPCGDILEINSEACKALGYSKEEIKGKPLKMIYAPESLPKMSRIFKRWKKTGSLRNEELSIITKSGERRIVLLSADAIKDKDGKIKYSVSVQKDITERKKSEDALKQSLNEINTLNALSRHVSSSLSKDTVIASALKEISKGTSPDAAILYLLKEDNMILCETRAEKPGLKHIGKCVKKVGECLCGQVAKEGKAMYSKDIHSDPRCTLDECKKAGIHSFAALPLIAEDRVIGLLGLASIKKRDFEKQSHFLETSALEISAALQNAILHEKLKQHAHDLKKSLEDTKKAEQEIQEVNERLKYLLTSTSAAIYTSKVSGDYGATNITENVKQIMGYEPGDFIEDSTFWINNVHPEDKNYVLENVELLFEKGKHIYEYRFLHSDGKYRWVRDEMNLVRDDQGNPVEIVGYWIDITDAKNAEIELIESEEKFRKLLKTSPDAVIVSDLEGHITEASDVAVKMFGAENKQEMLGCGISELVSPKNHDKASINLEKALMGDELERNLEYSLIRKDETSFTGEISASLVRGKSGQPRAFMVSIRDITERKKAEKAIRESEEKFRNLSEHSPNMIFINMGGRVVYANKRCEEIMGYKREEFYSPGFDFLTLIAPEYIELVKGNFRKHIEGENNLRYEYAIITKDGRRIDAIISSKVINYGGEDAILGIITDITPLRKAEREIKEERDRAQNYLDIAGVILIVIGTDGRVKLINKKGCEILGCCEKEILGKNWFDNFIPVRMVGEIKNIFENLIKGKIEFYDYFENPILTKSGGERIMAWYNTLLKDDEGNITGILSSGEDITQRKKVEGDLRKTADELARSNTELEEFVYGVAHDLRAPLRSMQGFSEALLEDYGERMDDKYRDYAGRIKASSKRMDNMINDLLSYSSITRAYVEIESIDIEQIFTDTISQYDEKIRKKDAKIEIKKPLHNVMGNKEILMRIIENLISNALKFTKEGVKPHIVIRSEVKKGMVRVWVEDNGIGIEPEYMEKIFRVFERLNSEKEYPGTGIGLAVVKKGVERIGGKAGVEPGLGGGSRFWIELPA